MHTFNASLRQRLLSNVPLQSILIVPFVFQILGAVGLVGYLSFRNGQQAVNRLAGQLRSEISARIEDELEGYLQSPHGFNRINGATLAQGQFDLGGGSNVAQFLRQLKVSDFAYAAYCGDNKGNLLGSARSVTETQSILAVVASNASSDYNFTLYQTDANGNRGSELKRIGSYDSRQRPWYQAAIAAQGQTWSEVYLDFAVGLPTITASEPVYGPEGRLLGVCATDIVLLQEFRQFLANLSIGSSGTAFVMDRSGAVLSSATDESLTQGEGEKMTLLQATDSSDSLIRGTANFLQKRFGSFAAIQNPEQLNFRLPDDGLNVLGGERQFVQVLPLQDSRGLDWLIVVAVPESDFMGQVYANTRITVLLCVLALAIATGVGILTARWVIQPLLALNSAAKDIAKGEFNRTVEIQRTDEVGELAKSFNAMAGQLKGSFRKLEQNNAELQHLDKLKDEFLANTSHELRTPLNGMIGISESMIDGATGKLTELQERNLWMIAQSGHRLSNLVNDILDFSKLKHQGLALQLKPVSLREVVEVVLALSQSMVGTKDLKLINSVPPSLPAAAADENRIQQILYNLIGNAVKFTASGTVEVFAELVQNQEATQKEQRQTDPSEFLVVGIVDTGVGIAADKLERIFEPFEQAEGSTAREFGGTGLGLAVTRQLVELHHGALTVTSTVGVGSQFMFTLPIAEAGATETITKEEKQKGKGGDRLREYAISTTRIQSISTLAAPTEKQLSSTVLSSTVPITSSSLSMVPNRSGSVVLVVDDEPVNLQVVVNHLSLHDYVIAQASNGQEALKMIEEGLKPSIVLLDVMMPRMTGYEVTQRLRERYPATDLPIVLLTAKTQVSDLVTGLDVGANDYLTKPISRDELLARIRTHINLSQLRAALQIEESKYRTMFENAVEGIFQSSPDGKLLNVNPAFARLFGYDSPELMLLGVQGIAAQIYVEADRRIEFKRIMEEQEEIRDFEFEAYRRDRTKIWVSVWARTVKDPTGTLLYYEGNCMDITQRKRQEASLKQQLQDLKTGIDPKQRARQVDEIASTDYFQQLMADADDLRYSDDD